MVSDNAFNNDIRQQLYSVGAVKFGDFKLKSGAHSPIYFDLRVIVSYPKLMMEVSEKIFEACADLKFDCICGVPYTALPLATCMCVQHNVPMLMRRKEVKNYGTGKILEGVFEPGQSCLIIEDVITTGSSVLETVEILKREGLRIAGVGVLLDREQGAMDNLKRCDIEVRRVLTISHLIKQLEVSKSISMTRCEQVRNFILENQTNSQPASSSATNSRCSRSFEQRAAVAVQPQARRLLSLMAEKETNLCVAADCQLGHDVLSLADRVGPYICVLKLHCDIIEDFSQELIGKLKEIANRHNFLLMEDRKLADIGHVVKLQATAGPFRIGDWADFVTVHPLPGPAPLTAIESCPADTACIIVAEMSSKGNLANDEYAAAALAMAETNSSLVAGLVCQSDLATDPGMVQFTPGVSASGSAGDSLGQQYRDPDHVIEKCGTDVVIVGRGVTQANDPRSAASSISRTAFAAYRRRIAAE